MNTHSSTAQKEATCPLDEITLHQQSPKTVRVGELTTLSSMFTTAFSSIINNVLALWPFRTQKTEHNQLEPKNGIIDLSNTNLTDMELLHQITHKERVTSLLLNDNHIAELPDEIFSDFPNLKMVSLRRNEITTIAPKALQGAINLEEFYVSRNRLENLPEELFCHTPEITIADFSFNDITTILPELLTAAPTLKRINLRINPLTQETKSTLADLQKRSWILLFDE